MPQSRETILEMLSYFCKFNDDNISGIILATTSNKPISLMINQFEAQMQLESAAVVSIVILFINILIKTVVYLVKRNLSNNKSNQV